MTDAVGIRSYAGYQNMAIPDEYLSSTAPRCFNSEIQQRVVQNQTGTVGASSRLVFSIPTGENSFIKGGSCYISATISISNSDAANTASFRKSRLGNALIKAVQLTANGVLISRCDNANDVMFLQYNHGASGQYYLNDAVVMEGSDFAAGATSSLQVFLPVPLGVLHTSSIPVWALPSNNLLLEVELETISGAFRCSAGSINGLAVSNAQLVYEALQVDGSMVQMLKQEMASAGVPWVLAYQEWRTFVQAGSSSLNVILGLNLSSVDAVFVVQRNNPATDLVAENYIAPTGTIRADIYCDGKRKNNFLRDSAIKHYPDLNLALSRLYDVSCSSTDYGTTMTRNEYADGANATVFAMGHNLRKSQSKATVMNGTSVNSLGVDLGGYSANNVIIIVAHTSLLQIDPNTGLVQIIR